MIKGQKLRGKKEMIIAVQFSNSKLDFRYTSRECIYSPYTGQGLNYIALESRYTHGQYIHIYIPHKNFDEKCYKQRDSQTNKMCIPEVQSVTSKVVRESLIIETSS